jgi:TonB family protein
MGWGGMIQLGGAMRRTAWALVAVAAAAALALPALAKKQNPAAVALFKKAIAASDIEAKGSPAYRLQAAVRVFGANNQYTDGMLVKFWTPDGKWREETILQGYQLVDVSDGKHEWTMNSVNYVPFDVHELWTALAFTERLRRLLDPTDTGFKGTGGLGLVATVGDTKADLSKPHIERNNGEECVKAGPGYAGTFCFDPKTGYLVREASPEFVSYEYSGYTLFGGESFPSVVRVYGPKNTELLEIHVDEIDPLPALTPGVFLPVQGSEEDPTEAACKSITPGKIGKMVRPVYPAEAKKKQIGGKVVFYAYVGSDGIPRGLYALESPSAVLTTAALQAVRQWQYRPRVCESRAAAHPLEAITYITVIFTLGGP